MALSEVKSYTLASRSLCAFSMKSTEGDRIFRRIFGISSFACSTDENQLLPNLPYLAFPVNSIWVLHLLNQYSMERKNCYILVFNPKTHLKWVWRISKINSSLEKLSTTFQKYSMFARLIVRSLTNTADKFEHSFTRSFIIWLLLFRIFY